MLVLAALYTMAAVFSGLSGFGFSALGCLSLVLLPPRLGVPVLMGLSLITQASSLRSLRDELQQHLRPWLRRDGVVPYLVGGTVGMPVGLAILAVCNGRALTQTLGLLLIAYAAWSLFKPPSLRLHDGATSVGRAFLVGTAGGVVGGFSAFPGSALVVWGGLLGLGKEHGRALTQPFVLWMQAVGLVLLMVTRPQWFGPPFWALLLAATPAALLGNRLGVSIYRRTGDRGYRRITLIALGVAGLGLLVKTALTPAA
jgi:uncharacterized membrane protein YfcA